VIDGSGGPAADDQVVIIEGDHISRLGPVSGIDVPSGTPTLDLRGRTIIPGLVGMHDHLFYQIEADRSSAHRWPVTVSPRSCAATTAAFNSAWRRVVYALNEVAPRSAYFAT
jgi:imidazolonepropionase-like amidohydrolase